MAMIDLPGQKSVINPGGGNVIRAPVDATWSGSIHDITAPGAPVSEITNDIQSSIADAAPDDGQSETVFLSRYNGAAGADQVRRRRGRQLRALRDGPGHQSDRRPAERRRPADLRRPAPSA